MLLLFLVKEVKEDITTRPEGSVTVPCQLDGMPGGSGKFLLTDVLNKVIHADSKEVLVNQSGSIENLICVPFDSEHFASSKK